MKVARACELASARLSTSNEVTPKTAISPPRCREI